MKLKQRQNHEKLAMGKSIPLFPHCKNYLVPSLWLSKWRDYINASGKNVSTSVKPETLDGVIDSLKCEKVNFLFCLTLLMLIIFRHLWWRLVGAWYAFESLWSLLIFFLNVLSYDDGDDTSTCEWILCKWLIKLQIVRERLIVNWLQWIETRLACVHLSYSNPHIFFRVIFVI